MESNKKIEKNQESAKKQENKEGYIEDSIEQLNKYLSDLKKDRQRTEKDERLLQYRNNILNMEENKAAKKLELAAKNQEKMEKIRVNMDKDKRMMLEKKKSDLINLEKQKNKNTNMKIKINNSLKSWKSNVTKKNKNEADKIKEERNQIRNLINETKEKNNNFNKEMHDSVQLNHLQFAEQKRYEDYLKKLQLKKEIEEQIQKELALKSELDLKIDEHQKKNQEIINRIKSFNDTGSKNSQRNYKFKSGKTPKKIENKK
jgi:hypothetical protein